MSQTERVFFFLQNLDAVMGTKPRVRKKKKFPKKKNNLRRFGVIFDRGVNRVAARGSNPTPCNTPRSFFFFKRRFGVGKCLQTIGARPCIYDHTISAVHSWPR
jgi:hypothetical protein